jgi:hypothetical protein
MNQLEHFTYFLVTKFLNIFSPYFETFITNESAQTSRLFVFCKKCKNIIAEKM